MSHIIVWKLNQPIPLATSLSSISHPANRSCDIPAEVGPDISAALTAGQTHEARLEIGKPEIIGPPIRHQRDGMAASVVTAIDKDPAHAGRAHVGKGDLHMANHRILLARPLAARKYSSCGGEERRRATGHCV